MVEPSPTAQETNRTPGTLSFDRFNRRLHLYLALALLPWFFVYGLSSAVFSHPAWFSAKGPRTKVLFEHEYRLDPITPASDLRPVADRIQRDTGLSGYFNVFRTPEGYVRMYGATFLSATQITYDPKKQWLSAEKSVFSVNGLLTRLHTRGGFERPGFLQQFWPVLVDVVQVAIMIWIASGLYMWWKLRRYRLWGFIALTAGFASFAWFLLAL